MIFPIHQACGYSVLFQSVHLYEKRETPAVNNLIKLIVNHLYRQFCHCYCQKNTSLNIVFSCSVRKLREFFCNMNFDEIDKNCSGGNRNLLHTNKLFICPKILFHILKFMICLFNLTVKLHS